MADVIALAAHGRDVLAAAMDIAEDLAFEAWTGDENDLEDEDRWLYVHPAGSRDAYLDVVDFIVTRRHRGLIARGAKPRVARFRPLPERLMRPHLGAGGVGPRLVRQRPSGPGRAFLARGRPG